MNTEPTARPEPFRLREYLGDSVFASVESGMIRLVADERKVIFLEPETFMRLLSFAEKAYNVEIRVNRPLRPAPEAGTQEHRPL